MIPLALVTGFLGGGKTTLLQRLIERERGRRLAYVVNEFAEADVDGRLFDLGEDQVLCIPGGSIFCRCLSGEFIRLLETLPGRFEDLGGPPEGVVIEASGIADPKVIVRMLEEHRLDRIYELRSVVSVIDPATFLKLIHTLPNVISQVEACDVALVNKTDLHEEVALRAVEREIERINPRAKIIRTSYCRSDVDLLAPLERHPLEGEYASCRDPNYQSVTVPLEQPLDPGSLMAELERIKDDVYRVKGFAPVSDGMLYVEVAAGRVSRRELALSADPGGPAGSGRLVFVFDPRATESVEGVIAKLKIRDEAASPSG
jgi:G3E family GTPase